MEEVSGGRIKHARRRRRAEREAREASGGRIKLARRKRRAPGKEEGGVAGERRAGSSSAGGARLEGGSPPGIVHNGAAKGSGLVVRRACLGDVAGLPWTPPRADQSAPREAPRPSGRAALRLIGILRNAPRPARRSACAHARVVAKRAARRILTPTPVGRGVARGTHLGAQLFTRQPIARVASRIGRSWQRTPRQR